MRTGNGIGIWRGNNGVTDGVALIPQNSYGHDEDNGLFFYVLLRRLYYSNNENVQIPNRRFYTQSHYVTDDLPRLLQLDIFLASLMTSFQISSRRNTRYFWYHGTGPQRCLA